MIDANLFQNFKMFWPVVFIALALWLLFVWKERNTAAKKRFYLHSLIALITVVSLAMLALKPLSTGMVHTNVGVLLTDRFSQNRLDSLKKKIKGIKPVYYKKNLPISEVLDSLGSLFVLGDGVEPFDFWQFENRTVNYLGADVPDGIVELKYTKENVLGQNLEIKGSYRHAQASTRLVLQNAAGRGLDSVELEAKELQNFELATAVKAKGKFVFELVEKDSLGKIRSSEPVPFKAVSNAYLKILLVNAFPTFETKYLKNYLAEMGHEVVVRSQLTRNRYKFEYLNTNRIPVYRLGENELESFDLLVLDGNSLKSLSESSWEAIDKAVRTKGLGIFIEWESALFTRRSERLGLAFERDAVSKVTWNEFPNVALEKFPYRFVESNNSEVIHRSSGGPIVVYKRKERGRIGTSLLQSTYQLLLDGKTEVYRRYWTDIVDELSKKEELIAAWQRYENFPLKQHPFEFELRTRVKRPHVYTATGSAVALRQSIDMPSLWSGTVYPAHQGWNELRLDKALPEVLDYYVVDSLAWQSLRAHSLQKANRRYFAAATHEPQKTIVSTPIKPFWFFLLALMGLSYLWLYPKFFR